MSNNRIILSRMYKAGAKATYGYVKEYFEQNVSGEIDKDSLTMLIDALEFMDAAPGDEATRKTISSEEVNELIKSENGSEHLNMGWEAEIESHAKRIGQSIISAWYERLLMVREDYPDERIMLSAAFYPQQESQNKDMKVTFERIATQNDLSLSIVNQILKDCCLSLIGAEECFELPNQLCIGKCLSHVYVVTSIEDFKALQEFLNKFKNLALREILIPAFQRLIRGIVRQATEEVDFEADDLSYDPWMLDIGKCVVANAQLEAEANRVTNILPGALNADVNISTTHYLEAAIGEITTLGVEV